MQSSAPRLCKRGRDFTRRNINRNSKVPLLTGCLCIRRPLAKHGAAETQAGITLVPEVCIRNRPHRAPIRSHTPHWFAQHWMLWTTQATAGCGITSTSTLGVSEYQKRFRRAAHCALQRRNSGRPLHPELFHTEVLCAHTANCGPRISRIALTAALPSEMPLTAQSISASNDRTTVAWVLLQWQMFPPEHWMLPPLQDFGGTTSPTQSLSVHMRNGPSALPLGNVSTPALRYHTKREVPKKQVCRATTTMPKSPRVTPQ